MGFEKYKAFSVVTTGNVDIKNSDCEGNMAVGKDAILKNFSLGIGFSPTINRGEINSLIIGGKIDIFNSVNYNGNTISQKLKYPKKYKMTNANGSFLYRKIFDFNEVYDDFKKIKNYISLKKDNTVIRNMNRNMELTSLFKNEPQFFTIDLSNNHEELKTIDFNVDSKSPIFINVVGENISFSNIEIKINGKVASAKSGSRMFWNFNCNSKIQIEDMNFYGAIFAVDCNVEIHNSKIIGNVYCKNLVCDSEISLCEIDRYLFRYVCDIDIYALQDINRVDTKTVDINKFEAEKIEVKKLEVIKSDASKVDDEPLDESLEHRSDLEDNKQILNKEVIKLKKSNDVTIEAALVQVLQSIALEEEGIANILNAEASKIKKIVEASNINSDYIEIDKSMNETLRNISIIQSLLIYKLEEVEKIISCRQ